MKIYKKIYTYILLFLILGICLQSVALAYTDKYSYSYLKNSKHISFLNPVAEYMVSHKIKSVLKKETDADFDVKFTGYTLSSMEKGIFKYLEIRGDKIVCKKIPLEHVLIKTLSDYNYIDYTQDPIVFKSNMELYYELELNEHTINEGLKQPEYKKIIDNVNNIAYPLFSIKSVRTKIAQSRMTIFINYTIPFSSRVRTFVTSTNFKVENGKVKACNVKLDSAYGLSVDKVANLINLLNPTEFIMNLFESKTCNVTINTIDFVDNLMKINGKIYIEGDN